MKRTITFRPRLLPMVMAAAAMLLGIKLVNLEANGAMGAIAAAWAQSAADKTGTSAADGAPAAAPASASTSAATPPGAADTPAPASAVARDPLLMSPSEIGELQQLAQRRAELDKRAAELSQQEVLMQAAEKRMDEKIAKLQSLQQAIDGTAQKQDQEDDERIKSLVKIYEAMKPQDAARIFEQLDMPVLLDVVARMRELKVAPVLAAMDPTKARALTLALAERRNQAAVPAPAAPAAAPPPPSP